MPKRNMSDLLPSKAEPSRDEKIGTINQKLAVSDRLSLEQQIKDTEENSGHSSTSMPTEMRVQLEHRKDLLRHDDDVRSRAHEDRDKLNVRKKQLEKVLADNMPSKEEMWRKTGTSESQQAIRHNIEFQKRFASETKEYQQVMARLEPDDPDAQSLERIRPDHRPGI